MKQIVRIKKAFPFLLLLGLVAHQSGAAVRVGIDMDESSLPGNDPANQSTARMPAGYASTLGVPDAAGSLFSGTLNGVGVTSTYTFSGDARWRIDPEIAQATNLYAYDGVDPTNEIRLVPRLDISGSTGVPALDVTIDFDQPVSGLRMYMFWLDLSQLQFTGSNTISINNSYQLEDFEIFSYDPATKTISDSFVRSANASGQQVEDGGLGAEIDFNNGGPTSQISFRITDNSPTITATHDGVRYTFSVPEPASTSLFFAFACLVLLTGRARR